MNIDIVTIEPTCSDSFEKSVQEIIKSSDCDIIYASPIKVKLYDDNRLIESDLKDIIIEEVESKVSDSMKKLVPFAGYSDRGILETFNIHTHCDTIVYYTRYQMDYLYHNNINPITITPDFRHYCLFGAKFLNGDRIYEYVNEEELSNSIKKAYKKCSKELDHACIKVMQAIEEFFKDVECGYDYKLDFENISNGYIMVFYMIRNRTESLPKINTLKVFV